MLVMEAIQEGTEAILVVDLMVLVVGMEGTLAVLGAMEEQQGEAIKGRAMFVGPQTTGPVTVRTVYILS